MARNASSSRPPCSNRHRMHLAEPPFGWIKQGLGFRQFSLRGLAKVTGEFTLVCLALMLLLGGAALPLLVSRLGAGPGRLAVAGKDPRTGHAVIEVWAFTPPDPLPDPSVDPASGQTVSPVIVKMICPSAGCAQLKNRPVMEGLGPG